jgi:hypothetical protein
MNKYEIFTSLEDIEIKDNAINQLLGYPNPETHTTQYRLPFKHDTEDLWAGVVDDELVNACSTMTEEERGQYYDADNLVDRAYLEANHWFDHDGENYE